MTAGHIHTLLVRIINQTAEYCTHASCAGDEIVFKDDEKITAKIVGEREVEYDGQFWKLTPLAYSLYEQRGKLNASGAGADYFKYKGKKLRDLPDSVNYTEEK